MRVLLLDDDRVFGAMLARALARRGAAVGLAASSAELATVSAELRPTHVVLDLKLGTEFGLDLLPQLLAAEPRPRVLILTGYASVATAVQAIKLGADDYLAKPVDAEQVWCALTGRPRVLAEALPTPSLPRLEWEHIQRVLAEHGGNVSAAARALGMHRRSLQRKLAKRAPR
jgi:two-component system response regulator RegA